MASRELPSYLANHNGLRDINNIDDQVPLPEDIRRANQKSRAYFIRLLSGTLFSAGVATNYMLNQILDENEQTQEKEIISPPLPDPRAVPGENLISQSDLNDFQIRSFPGKERTYQIPNGWTPSNPDTSRYWHGLGPNRTSCLEVEPSAYSSWLKEEPITIERGIYQLSASIRIKSQKDRDSLIPEVQPEIALIPLPGKGDGNFQVFSSIEAGKIKSAANWRLVTDEIVVNNPKPQQVRLLIAGYEIKRGQLPPTTPLTIQFADLNLRRMISPQGEHYQGKFQPQI